VITICLTYFRSLTLANLTAALYSIGRQDFSNVQRIIVVDNDTDDPMEAIKERIDAQAFPVPVGFTSRKHGMKNRTHAWSTNVALQDVDTKWAFFTRADYLLDFSAVAKFWAIADAQGNSWNGFVTSNGRHVHQDIDSAERSNWRAEGPSILHGIDFGYTCIDAGVWMATREIFRKVGGLDERLSNWGHAQTHFQYKLHSAGTECVRINETLFYHPAHGAERDLAIANQELQSIGVTAHELWARHEGANPY
jgi:glycosyltransferase involved in cell wall biosynthesis